MILRIGLFLSCGMLVSSNNGYSIIPAQTYPIYQQNGYSNPPANQASDIGSFLQGLVVQNQSPTLDLSPSSIQQILLNRMLTGQSTQTSFDHNSRGHGSNLVELLNNAIAPNAVNNYFAVPTVNNQSAGVNNEDKLVDDKTEGKRKKSKKRKSKSRRKQNEPEKNHKNSNENDTVNDLQESNKKSKKRSRKAKTGVSTHENHTNNSDIENHKKSKKKKRKNIESEVKNPDDDDDETKHEPPKPRRRRKKKPKSDKENADKVVSETRTNKPKQIQEGINVAHFNEGIVEENRIPRNLTPETADLFRSIPNIPENIANSFKGLPQFNNPAMSNFYANYEKMYQSMMANNKGTNEHIQINRRKPTNSRNNNKRKIEVKNKDSTATQVAVLKTLDPKVTPKINVVTTDNTIYIKENIKQNSTIDTNIDPNPKDEVLTSIEKPPEVKESIHKFDNEETNDVDLNINDPLINYERYIDDYYPQFTDSAAYTANKREVYIKNIGDNKYYYAVDKGKPELINRMRFESFGLPERIIKDYEVNKKYGDTENDCFENALQPDSKDIKEDEEIQFRSPPPLEIPDFHTRKVERSEINPETLYNFDENDYFDPKFLGDKASIYSEAKIPYYPGAKENSKKIFTNKPKDVETVFARSKVVNYGSVYNPEEDSVSPYTSKQELTDDSYFKDGGTTYVLASSLDHPAMFSWKNLLEY